jgi:hypothetical protein
MQVIEKAFACLVLAVGAGAWFMESVNCHAHWNVHRARAMALESAIESYAQDTGHLPGSLGDLLQWRELGWQGPYRRAGDLLDVDGTAFSYEIVDDRRQAFRLILPARTAPDSTTVWPALVEENEGTQDAF